MIQTAILAFVPLCLAAAAISDVMTMTIPNRVSLLLAVAFLAAAPLSGMPLADMGMSLAAGAAVFGVCFGLFAANVMGGGDAKLLTATALWFGWSESLVVYLLYVGFLGGTITLLILFIRAHADHVLALGIRLPASLSTARKIPYGLAIGLAGFLMWPKSPLFALLLAAG